MKFYGILSGGRILACAQSSILLLFEELFIFGKNTCVYILIILLYYIVACSQYVEMKIQFTAINYFNIDFILCFHSI